MALRFIIYANTNKSSLQSLITLNNNKIVRVLQNQPYCTRTVQLYKQYNTLPVPEFCS